MKVNENENQNKKVNDAAINKIAEKIYQQIAGDLPDIDTSTGDESYLPNKKVDNYLQQAFYSPIEMHNSKTKKEKKKINLADVNKLKAEKEKNKSKSNTTGRSKVSFRNKIIV